MGGRNRVKCLHRKYVVSLRKSGTKEAADGKVRIDETQKCRNSPMGSICPVELSKRNYEKNS